MFSTGLDSSLGELTKIKLSRSWILLGTGRFQFFDNRISRKTEKRIVLVWLHWKSTLIGEYMRLKRILRFTIITYNICYINHLLFINRSTVIRKQCCLSNHISPLAVKKLAIVTNSVSPTSQSMTHTHTHTHTWCQMGIVLLWTRYNHHSIYPSVIILL